MYVPNKKSHESLGEQSIGFSDKVHDVILCFVGIRGSSINVDGGKTSWYLVGGDHDLFGMLERRQLMSGHVQQLFVTELVVSNITKGKRHFE
jgi:hypothetical protein